jgi:hypothetical protein
MGFPSLRRYRGSLNANAGGAQKSDRVLVRNLNNLVTTGGAGEGVGAARLTFFDGFNYMCADLTWTEVNVTAARTGSLDSGHGVPPFGQVAHLGGPTFCAYNHRIGLICDWLKPIPSEILDKS